MIDLEHIARELLQERGISCAYYVPKTISGPFVTVKRTARPGSTRFEGRAMLTVQARASTRHAASQLCQDAVDALVGRGGFEGAGLVASHPDITGCAPENGPYRWDDPGNEDMKRWQATVSVDYNI